MKKRLAKGDKYTGKKELKILVTATTLRRIGNVLGQNIEQQSAAIEVFVSFLFFFIIFDTLEFSALWQLSIRMNVQ